MKKLSAHSINLYRDCPRKYLYYYDDSIEPLPHKYEDEMRVGRKVHKTIENFYEANPGKKEKTKNDILMLLARAMDNLEKEESFENEDRMFNNMKGFIEFEIWRRKNELKLISAEEFIEDDDICGRIDAIFKTRTKKICVDFKTGYNSTIDETKRIQAMVYKLLADWDDFFFVYTIWNDKKKVKDKGEDWIRGIVEEVKRGISENGFERDEGEKCKECEFSIYCKAEKSGFDIWGI